MYPTFLRFSGTKGHKSGGCTRTGQFLLLEDNFFGYICVKKEQLYPIDFHTVFPYNIKVQINTDAMNRVSRRITGFQREDGGCKSLAMYSFEASGEHSIGQWLGGGLP